MLQAVETAYKMKESSSKKHNILDSDLPIIQTVMIPKFQVTHPRPKFSHQMKIQDSIGALWTAHIK